jgi:MtN3 and saliva related transmembrane protein
MEKILNIKDISMEGTTVLGLIAATITTSSFLPQAIQTLRTKHTKDISLGMYSLLTTGVLLWLIYGVMTKDLPLLIANGITFLFSVLILVYKVVYK